MLKLKDIIALGLLAVVSFPMVLLGVLLWTGNVRMVFGPEANDPGARARLLERPEDIPGATQVEQQHGTDQPGPSTATTSGDLDQQEAEVLRETRRLEELRAENQAIRDAIVAERERLERLLTQGDSLENRRTEVLAATFTSMKADQAAKILAALDDVLVTAILRKVSDDKPRGKLLAALGKIDIQRAARVTRLLDNGRDMPRQTAAADTKQSGSEGAIPGDTAAPSTRNQKP